MFEEGKRIEKIDRRAMVGRRVKVGKRVETARSEARDTEIERHR